MRITNRMILQNALKGLFGNLEALHRAQEEVATGHRLQRSSDQPLNASTIIRLDSQLRGLERYRRAGVSANTLLSTEQVVLQSVDDLLRQAKDMVSPLGSSPDDPLHQSAIQVIKDIRDQIISLGNTRVSGDYVFAGGGIAPPFMEDGTYVGDTVVGEVEIAEGLRVSTNHTGEPILTDVLDSLQMLTEELSTGTPESVQSVLEDLEQAARGVRQAQAEIGSRMRQVQEMEKHIIQQSASLLDHQQALREVDPAESVLKFNQAQITLERAYAAVSKVLSTSILDYLR